MTAPPFVVGLDPSLTGTGIALPGGQRVTIGSKPSGPRWPDRRLRYYGIIRRIIDAIEARPEFDTSRLLVAIEGYAFSRNGQGHADIVECGALLRDKLSARYGIGALVEVGPSSLKLYATGKGNAGKADLRVALVQRTGIDEPDENRVDAEWLRLLALDGLGFPVLTMPAKNRTALNAVQWPTLAGIYP